jgi:hypothetical protein
VHRNKLRFNTADQARAAAQKKSFTKEILQA